MTVPARPLLALLAAALAAVALAAGGCGRGGGAGTWQAGGRTYAFTPDRLAGRWASHGRVIEFRADGTLTWGGAPGRWSFLSDRSLRVAVPASAAGPGVVTSFRYSAAGDTLALLDNQDGTLTEYARAPG